MRRLALLVLCDAVDRVGGTESYLGRVLPALARYGIDVTIVGRRVVDPFAFGPRASEIAWASDDEPPRPDAAREVEATIARLRPDVVMTSNVHDHDVMSAARSAPYLVVRVHDHRLFCPQGDRQFPHGQQLCTSAMSGTTCVRNALLRGCVSGFSPKTLRVIRSREALRRAALLADRFVVASKFVSDLCLENGVDARRIDTIPPPFGGEAMIVASPRPARDRVLFAGRLVRDKGLESLIRAISLLPPDGRPELAVAGAPTRESQPMPKLARSLEVDLAMLGRLDTAALNAEIDASTLVAVPSLWPEPFGLTGIEAQARGRPVVAYDVGGISEWMGDAGLLAPRGDTLAFARAIRGVSDRRRWPSFSAAGLRQAARYQLDMHLAPLARALTSAGYASSDSADSDSSAESTAAGSSFSRIARSRTSTR
jgi:glycosyltransferase involved in cell wall biosynthesis